MKKKILTGVLFAAALALTGGCAKMESAGHKYIMRGQILEVSNNTAYLCIGSSDGAKVGQELAVYKFEKVPMSPKSSGPNFKREETGAVKIMEIVDEHYAKANVLTGEVKANYVVELK